MSLRDIKPEPDILVSIHGLDPVSSLNFWMVYINVYLSHAVAKQRLICCISMLPGTSQFITLLTLGKHPLPSTPGNVVIIR